MCGLAALGRHLELPLRSTVLTRGRRFPDTKDVGALKLDSWIREIDWVSELSFALAGRSRDYWYAQQLSIATMVFSVFVSVEGESALAALRERSY